LDWLNHAKPCQGRFSDCLFYSIGTTLIIRLSLISPFAARPHSFKVSIDCTINAAPGTIGHEIIAAPEKITGQSRFIIDDSATMNDDIQHVYVQKRRGNVLPDSLQYSHHYLSIPRIKLRGAVSRKSFELAGFLSFS
jgi:hypothetical protein